MALLGLLAAMPDPAALGSFHFMQIEQVIGGVDGHATVQAVQLRMRRNAQEQLNNARLVAWDAAGENPVLLIDFATNIDITEAGTRILIASEEFSRYTVPAAQPDYVLTKLIPAGYLAAGSITFESDDGELVVWRLSWGGTAYTGSNSGSLTNEDDGEFGPPLATPLPQANEHATLFNGAIDALSAANVTDYALTTGAAVFTNSSGAEFTVAGLQCPSDPHSDADHDHVCGDVDNCPDDANEEQLDSDGDGVGDACDNCVDTVNADQVDADGDGAGDACDSEPRGPGSSTDDQVDSAVAGGEALGGAACPVATVALSLAGMCAAYVGRRGAGNRR